MDIVCDVDRNLQLYRQAHQAICRAELPPSTAAVAHELLAMAELENGQINMTWEALADLTGCENVNAARRHLSRLAAAKLVHYSTNDYVYVTWLEWMVFDVYSNVPALQTSKVDDDGSARVRATTSALARSSESATEHEIHLFGAIDAPPAARPRSDQRASAPPLARGRAERRLMLVSQLVDPIQKKDHLLTNSPSPQLEEQRRSVALLTDAEVGLDTTAAWRFARRHEFEQLVPQVMSYRRQLKAGIVQGPGALVKRLTEGYGGTTTDDDRKTALYRRHHPDWQREEERKTKKSYIPDEYADIIIH